MGDLTDIKAKTNSLARPQAPYGDATWFHKLGKCLNIQRPYGACKSITHRSATVHGCKILYAFACLEAVRCVQMHQSFV